MMRKQVFISYRQESPEHARTVRRLGELLRQAGIRVALDQFLLDDRPGGPDEGWPKWCEDCANQSETVLIIASEGWIGDRLGIEKLESPTVRWPPPVPFIPDLADRSKLEWPAVVDLLAGATPERILLYEGGTGLGKSLLVRQAAAYAGKLGVSVVYLDFKGGGMDVKAILDQFDLDLGSSYLPNFVREGAAQTTLLRKDLRALRKPVMAIFDGYELAADNDPVANWLSQQILVEVETAIGLAVIVAGQEVPDFADARWRDLARHIPLGPITEIGHWENWVDQRFPGFDKQQHRPTILKLAEGNPANVSTYCKTIAEQD